MVRKRLANGAVAADRPQNGVEVAVFSTGVFVKGTTHYFGIFEIVAGVPTSKISSLEAAVG